ncbi:hypothetical protein XT56_003886 [Salmonella enterica subsp. enterica]|nr:hypothetical protein [Salmonella enterica subsp. enterica]
MWLTVRRSALISPATEHATPVGAPIITPAEPWTIGPPTWVMSPCRAAGFPPMLNLRLFRCLFSGGGVPWRGGRS